MFGANLMTGCSATHKWRGNNDCYWVRLNSNMTLYRGSITCIAQNDPAFGPDFVEAPWIYKRNGLWYLLYTSSIPENIGYTTSSSPTAPWTFRSMISAAIR
jgi:arabinoxylan arabinofuranohydrolase